MLYLYDCSSQPPKTPRRVASAIPVNSPQATSIESDLFKGQVLAIHGGDPSSPYADYFAGKSRRWEFRVQGCFKMPLPGKLFVGVSTPSSVLSPTRLLTPPCAKQVLQYRRRNGKIGLAASFP